MMEEQAHQTPGGQPTPVAVQDIDELLKTGQWTHGLCGCFDNIAVCLIAYFVPCVTFGQTHQRLYGSGCVLYGLLWLIPIVDCVLETQHRGELRRRRGIGGSSVGDCCTIFCCMCCTLIQEEQEALALEGEKAALEGRIHPGQGGAAIVVTSGNTPTMYPAGQGTTYAAVTVTGTNPPMYPPGPGAAPASGGMYPPPAYPNAPPTYPQAYPQAAPVEVKDMDRM